MGIECSFSTEMTLVVAAVDMQAPGWTAAKLWIGSEERLGEERFPSISRVAGTRERRRAMGTSIGQC